MITHAAACLRRLFATSVVCATSLAACDRSAVTAVGTPGQPFTLLWRNANSSALGRTVFDDSSVYSVDFRRHVISAANKQTGAVRWTSTITYTNGRCERQGSELTIAGGHLVVGDLDAAIGLDLQTGAVVWRFLPVVVPYAQPGLGCVTSDGTTIYAGSVTGRVYAIDAATGDERWNARVANSTMAAYDPTIADGVLYVALSSGVAGRYGGGAAAVDIRNGRLIWFTPLPIEPPRASYPRGVGITPTLVVVATENEVVYGLDRQTGAIRLTIPGETFRPAGVPRAGSGTGYAITSLGDTVFVGSGWNIVVALDGSDLHVLWRTPVDGVLDLRAEPARLYVAGGGLYVLRTTDGKLIWSVPPQAFLVGLGGGEFFNAVPSLDADRVYIGGDNGIYAFIKK